MSLAKKKDTGSGLRTQPLPVLPKEVLKPVLKTEPLQVLQTVEPLKLEEIKVNKLDTKPIYEPDFKIVLETQILPKTEIPEATPKETQTIKSQPLKVAEIANKNNMALKDLFKPGAILGKGGIVGKALVGIGNTVVSNLTGGALQNVFKTTTPTTQTEQIAEHNAKVALQSVGAAYQTYQTNMIKSPEQLLAEEQAKNSPFSAQNANKTMTSGGIGVMLGKYWYIIVAAAVAMVLLIVKPFGRRRRY